MAYVLDLETTTDKNLANKTRKELLFENEATFICATMYAPIDSTCDNISEFYGKDNAENAILNLPSDLYYTWNGARFDMHFIYHLLRKAGYEKQENPRSNEGRAKQLKKYQFTYLLSGARFISLAFRNENGLVEIQDACLLFTCSLERFIQNTCPEFPKLVNTYDYSKYRIVESDFTEQDIEYCRADIKGFAIGMYRIQSEFGKAFDMDILNSYTAGSFSMKYARKYIADVKETFPKTSFNRDFVAGGKVYVNPLKRGKIIKNVTKIDANSFYPSMMVNSKLPHGKLTKVVMTSDRLRKFLKDNEDLYVFAELKNGICSYDDMFSPITTLDKIGNRHYPLMAGATDGVFLDDNILRDEKFDHDGTFLCYVFESTTGTIFNYLRRVYSFKNQYAREGKKALELAVKIILNSTYGKFIQKDIIKEYDFFDGIIGATGVNKTMNSWYLYPAMGAAITANCRYLLTKYMNILGDRFIYCDTDSLVFTGDCPPEIPLGIELGEWKVEANSTGEWEIDGEKFKCDKATEGIFFDPKTYAINLNGKTQITFCGISSKAIQRRYPNDVSISQLKEDIIEGIDFQVLQSNKTLNGIVLVERTRTKFYKEDLVFNLIDEEDVNNGDILIERASSKKYVDRY